MCDVFEMEGGMDGGQKTEIMIKKCVCAFVRMHAVVHA